MDLLNITCSSFKRRGWSINDSTLELKLGRFTEYTNEDVGTFSTCFLLAIVSRKTMKILNLTLLNLLHFYFGDVKLSSKNLIKKWLFSISLAFLLVAIKVSNKYENVSPTLVSNFLRLMLHSIKRCGATYWISSVAFISGEFSSEINEVNNSSRQPIRAFDDFPFNALI